MSLIDFYLSTAAETLPYKKLLIFFGKIPTLIKQKQRSQHKCLKYTFAANLHQLQLCCSNIGELPLGNPL